MTFLARGHRAPTRGRTSETQPAGIWTVRPSSLGCPFPEKVSQAHSLLRAFAHAVPSARIALPYILLDCSPFRFQLQNNFPESLSLILIPLHMNCIPLCSQSIALISFMGLITMFNSLIISVHLLSCLFPSQNGKLSEARAHSCISSAPSSMPGPE